MTNSMPSSFGRYQVLKLLGEGSFGTVYLANDTQLGREVVLKVLKEELAAEPSMVQYFIEDARALAQLRHPNMVLVYSIGQTHQPPYVVTELVRGTTLEETLRQKVYPLQETYLIFQQMAAALQAGHREGLVHHDLTPSNVVIRADGEVKLTDFGMIKRGASAEEMVKSDKVALHSARYMAPEQGDVTLHDQIGPATDVYALGVIVYQMLTGRVPFDSFSPEAIFAAHRTVPPPDPRAFGAKMPASLVKVLTRALAKQPADRYPTAGAFMKAFRQQMPSEAPTRLNQAAPDISMPSSQATPPPAQPKGDVPTRPNLPPPSATIADPSAPSQSRASTPVPTRPNLSGSSGSARQTPAPPKRDLSAPPSRGSNRSVPPTSPTSPDSSGNQRKLLLGGLAVVLFLIIVGAFMSQGGQVADAVDRVTVTTQESGGIVPATATSAPSTPPADAIVRPALGLNLRSGPGTEYNVLASYPQGIGLSVIGREPDGSWVQIESRSGRRGWMFAGLLDLNIDLDEVPEVAVPPTPTPRPPTRTPKPPTPTPGLSEDPYPYP
ncbi:MAG: protein kinase domain-containing protein [Ardenticatenaceae bacterium]